MKSDKTQSGNAMVYVLIIVALFAAISFVLGRQTDSSEAGALSDERAEIYASMIQQNTLALKQSIEQMTWTGTDIDNLDFITPDDGNFDVGSPADKVFHPAGGGMTLKRIPDEALNEVNANPPARWYINRFNNVEWTPGPGDDVLLTAHQVSEAVCRRINLRLTGSENIPVLTASINRLLILSTETAPDPGNIEFTSARCAACYGRPSLCVEDAGATGIYSFYSIVAAQ